MCDHDVRIGLGLTLVNLAAPFVLDVGLTLGLLDVPAPANPPALSSSDSHFLTSGIVCALNTSWSTSTAWPVPPRRTVTGSRASRSKAFGTPLAKIFTLDVPLT